MKTPHSFHGHPDGAGFTVDITADLHLTGTELGSLFCQMLPDQQADFLAEVGRKLSAMQYHYISISENLTFAAREAMRNLGGYADQ